MLRKYLSLIALSLFSLSVYAQSAQNLFRMSGDPVVGNLKGSITMVEFLDYECSHCIEMAPVVMLLMKDNTDLRVVYKIVAVRGPQSEQAAKAALAANLQGKFNAFNQALLSSRQELSDDVIFSLAKSTGLDVSRLKKDMKSENVSGILSANMTLASELAIPGTPAFFFGKTDAKDLNSITSIVGGVGQRELQNSVNVAGQ